MNVVSQHLQQEKFQQGIEMLFRTKPVKEAFCKAAEELSELATKLLQHANKQSDDTFEAIPEEIVDAQMHLELLQKYFSEKVLIATTDEKVEKMYKSKDFRFYQSFVIALCATE